MKKKYFKKCLCLGLAVITAFCMAGCKNSNLVDLSEENKDLYAEYAANLILKHDKNYIDRMRYVEPVQETTTEPVSQEPVTENPKNPTNPSNPQGPADTQVSDTKSMNELFAINGLDIQPNGYEVTNAYPSNGSELGMSMQAIKGYKLLIYKFNVVNTAGQDVALNMMEQTASYRGIINDSVKVNVQVTALLNALNTYHGVIPAGSTQELVLISQINENDAKNISSVKLNITYNDRQGTVVIN